MSNLKPILNDYAKTMSLSLKLLKSKKETTESLNMYKNKNFSGSDSELDSELDSGSDSESDN